MASTFLKRFDLLRNDFHNKTSQWPQLRKASDGKEKSSGIGADLGKIDAALDAAGGVDVATLTSAYQAFEKHARTYAQQIDAKPGVGVLEWMGKGGAAPPRAESDKIVAESQAFGKKLEILIKDVDATVVATLKHASGRKEKARILQALKDEALGWTKYIQHDGISVMMSPANAELIPNPKTGVPAVDILRAGTIGKAVSARLIAAVAQIKGIETASLLPPLMTRNIKLMTQAMTEARSCALELIDALQMWNVEYTQVMAAVQKRDGAPHRDRPRVVALMAKVEAAKQSLMKLDIKTAAAKKALEAIL